MLNRQLSIALLAGGLKMHDRAEGGSGRAGVGWALIRRRQGGGGWPGQGSARGRRGGGGGAGGFKKGALGATFVRRPFVASKRQLPTLIKATTSYTPYEV